MNCIDDICIVEEKYNNNTLYFGSTITNHDKYDSKYIYETWKKEDFNFLEENQWRKGLRPPQIAGLFSALAHLKSSDHESATIVMPTGTGKTETLLSLTVAGKFERTLVLVPSDALREQIKDKFVSLGLLREFGLVKNSILNPKVLVVKQGFKSDDDVGLVEHANIIITTPSALNKCTPNAFKLLTNKCSHLIVDEAHHVVARTWTKIKNQFKDKPVIQFTATPYRSDGQRVDGKIIYSYSIKSAQKDGYFKKIDFHPIREYVDDKSDLAIALKAIQLLKDDLDSGYNHILMARTNTIKRASFVYEIYKKYKELSPILITSKEIKKKAIIDDIKNGKHRVIVCVNMLGEGFDLPELKIAALHDVHKSINITLQFTGRFTRVINGIGNAKFIANIADPKVNDMLEELYNEDADWNRIIEQIGTKKLSVEQEYQNFRDQFNNNSKLIDQGLNPKISTTVYTTETQKWTPDHFVNILDNNSELIDFILNNDKTLLLFSLKTYIPVSWSHSHEIRDIIWNLYIAYFNKKQKLLYIHSSCKEGLNNKLAKAVSDSAKKITGEQVFRALDGVKRLSFQNVGLNRDRKDLRYIMYTGTDTKEAIPQLETRRARKSNIFGKGFEKGIKTTIGCSHKGKIWAMDSSSVDNWVRWCDIIGEKILNDSINTNEILKTAMRSDYINSFADIAIVGIDWPLTLLQKNEQNIKFNHKGKAIQFIDSEITIKTGVSNGNKIDFIISSTEDETFILNLSQTLNKNNEFEISSEEYAQIIIGDVRYKLDEFFYENPPLIYLANTSIVEGNILHYSEENYLIPFEKEKIEAWDWTGVDISVESQKKSKIANSIQYFTIHKIKQNYDIVFDDDGSGEVADIVAIKNIDDEELIIDFFHCKYCSKKNGEAKPGSRVDDAYQVSGQAIKGVRWVHNNNLFDRLIMREKRRLSKEEPSRIDKGSLDELIRLRKVSKFAKAKYSFFIVQPAISKTVASSELLSIFGAAETYIQETTGSKLNIITSK